MYLDEYMDEIQNHNCDGMCAEEMCDKKTTHFMWIEINGMKISIVLCEEHAEKWNDDIDERYRKLLEDENKK